MSEKVNPDKVEQLVEAALVGMESHGGEFTGREFLSASFTLVLRVIKSTLEKSPESLQTIKQAVEVLYLECAPKGKSN